MTAKKKMSRECMSYLVDNVWYGGGALWCGAPGSDEEPPAPPAGGWPLAICWPTALESLFAEGPLCVLCPHALLSCQDSWDAQEPLTWAGWPLISELRPPSQWPHSAWKTRLLLTLDSPLRSALSQGSESSQYSRVNPGGQPPKTQRNSLSFFNLLKYNWCTETLYKLQVYNIKIYNF